MSGKRSPTPIEYSGDAPELVPDLRSFNERDLQICVNANGSSGEESWHTTDVRCGNWMWWNSPIGPSGLVRVRRLRLRRRREVIVLAVSAGLPAVVRMNNFYSREHPDSPSARPDLVGTPPCGRVRRRSHLRRTFFPREVRAIFCI
jgi:hypothetical protein